MENIASDFRPLGKLNKTFKELHKDIENQLNSTRSSLQSLFEELVECENEILSKEKQLEAKELELDVELELKVKQLDEIKRLSKELSEEIEVKMEQCNAIRIIIEEREREFYHIEKSVSMALDKLKLLKGSIQQKSEEDREMLKQFDKVTDLKEDMLNATQRSLDRCMKEFGLKKEMLKVCQISIDERDNAIKLKEEKLNSIQNSIVECSYELKLKEHQLDLVRRLKEKSLGSIEELMNRCAHEFEMKERKIENSVKSLDLKEELLESKLEELYLIDKKVNGCLKEVELKEKNFASHQRLVEERYHKLEMKEREFERRVNEFKLREEEFESIRRSAEMGEKERKNLSHSVVTIDQLEQTHASSTCHQSCIANEKKDFFWLLNQLLERHDLVCGEIFSVLKASLDPSKLALDAIHGINHLYSSSVGTEFDDRIARRGCNLLLELLMKASREINPQVKEEAMKLASDWKAKLNVTSDNCLEVFGLLQFLVSFRLASAFDMNERRSLLDAVGLNTQANQLDSYADIAQGYIQTLIEREEIIRAVGLISELKLTEKFPPVPLLIEYLDKFENSTQIALRDRKLYKAKEKALCKELAALRAVMKCIKFCNLESEFPAGKISKRMHIMLREGQSLSCHEVELSTTKKRRKNSVYPQDQTQQSKTKCPQTTIDNAVGANTSSGPALLQSPSPNIRTGSPECFVKLNFGFPPKDQTKQSKTKRPQTTELNNAVGTSSSSASASPQPPSPNGWTKPPEGFVKLNIGFVGQSDCGFLSVVACDNNGAILAIWCRKIPQSDPLTGEALAALGALTLAFSKGWDAIFLEGDSLQLISYLQRGSEPVSSISSVVSDSLALMQSFRRAIPVWIPPETNTLPRNVSQWAAGNNVQDGLSWISVPNSLFFIFQQL